MADRDVLAKVSELVDEEHRLRRGLASGDVSSDDEHARLRDLEQELDQCWDLLRQRRAARDFGQDPDSARVRPASEVEG